MKPTSPTYTAQKMKFFIKDFLSKCDQIRRKLRIWSHLPKKYLMEDFNCNCIFITKRLRERWFTVNFGKFLSTAFHRTPPDDCFWPLKFSAWLLNSQARLDLIDLIVPNKIAMAYLKKKSFVLFNTNFLQFQIKLTFGFNTSFLTAKHQTIMMWPLHSWQLHFFLFMGNKFISTNPSDGKLLSN